MTPVFQTRFGTDKGASPSTQGNCFPAAFASLFDLSLEEAPDFDDGAVHWFDPWDKWCQANGRDWTWVIWGEHLPANAAPAGYAIGTGPSPRGDFNHSVVTEDGIPVHDPAGVDVAPVSYCTDYVVFSQDWESSEVFVPLVALPAERCIPDSVPSKEGVTV